MWMMSRVLLAWIGLAAGLAVAGGFVAFLSLIGIVPRLAGVTKTAANIPLYENCLALGLITMNLISLYAPALDFLPITIAETIINAAGLFTGIFVGCLAGALAEVVNIIPILSRRLRIRKGFPYYVKAFALGKCAGSLLQFYFFC